MAKHIPRKPITDSDPHSRGCFTSHGLLSIGSQLTWGAQGFITFMMAGWLLPKQEFGFVVVGNAILFGGQCLLLGPITNPTLRFGATSRKSVRVTYLIYLIVTGIVCSTFVLLSRELGGLIYKDGSFFTLIKYLSIPFATTSFYAVQKLVLFAKMRYKAVLAMDVLFATSSVAILLLLHANSMLSSALWFYMARSAAGILGLSPVAILYFVYRRAPHPQSEEQFHYRHYLQHSKYSSVSMLSGYGQGQVDTLAVAHFLGPLGAATYGVAKIFYTGMTMITNGIVMVAIPGSSRIATSGIQALGGYYRKALLLAYLLLLPGAAVLAVLAGPIVHLCFRGRYGDAVPIVRIMCVAALVLPISSITDAVANGAGWFRSACLASIIGSGIGISMSLSLPRVFGLHGAALAILLALCGSACAIAALTWGRLNMRCNPLVRRSEAVVAPAAAND